MAFKIIWSEFAEKQLDAIYYYYTEKANTNVAVNIIHGIIKEPEKLKKMPLLGQEEELLKDKNAEYRYLIFKNYKLIYSVDHNNELVKIADVFDTRQNPTKLKRTR
ncbi:MAG: type II toxin-antitoxin system RelE/ParE family toxin [Cyclobacteriaceae bacterium]